MPAPKQQKKKEGPRSAGRSKKDYSSLVARAKGRRHKRAEARTEKLARLQTKHGVPSLSNERRRTKRLARFGDRPLLSVGHVDFATS